MKKLLLLVICVFTFFATSVYSEGRIIDDAGLLKNADVRGLDVKAYTASADCMSELIIITTNDTNGKTPEAYTMSFYKSNNYGYGDSKSAVLLLLDAQSESVRIDAFGDAQKRISKDKLNLALDNIKVKVAEGDFTNAVLTFLDNVSSNMSAPVPTAAPTSATTKYGVETMPKSTAAPADAGEASNGAAVPDAPSAGTVDGAASELDTAEHSAPDGIDQNEPDGQQEKAASEDAQNHIMIVVGVSAIAVIIALIIFFRNRYISKFSSKTNT